MQDGDNDVPASVPDAEGAQLPNELWHKILLVAIKDRDALWKQKMAVALTEARIKRWCPRCKVSRTDPVITTDSAVVEFMAVLAPFMALGVGLVLMVFLTQT